LSYLRKFPVDTLKIDQSFIRQVTRDFRVRSIIDAVVALAHALDIEVTAEGVETNAELSQVVSTGCDLAQGYLFARPLPVDALNKYLISVLEAQPAA
jgi:EAL domain-containing protein (putative c-di-GMP-specific phosphodiesterase class I)